MNIEGWVAKLVELLQSNPTTLQGGVAALSALIVTCGSMLCFNPPKRPGMGVPVILLGIAVFFVPTLVPPPAPAPFPRDFSAQDWRIFEQKGYGFKFQAKFDPKTHEITGKMAGISWPGKPVDPDQREPFFHGTYDSSTGVLIFTRDDVHQDYTLNLHNQDYGTGRLATRDDGTFEVCIFRLNTD